MSINVNIFQHGLIWILKFNFYQGKYRNTVIQIYCVPVLLRSYIGVAFLCD